KLLSTILKLRIEDNYFLFTSDGEKFSFERILAEGVHKLERFSIRGCQMPHHGSENNHFPAFWKSLVANKDKDAVVSAGSHKGYSHPDFIVVEFFHKSGYNIHATNIINGMKEFQ